MRTKHFSILALLLVAVLICYSFTENGRPDSYKSHYQQSIARYNKDQQALLQAVANASMDRPADVAMIKDRIKQARLSLKAIDFWLRYLDPVAYMKINGPLPVEWETEVFEKFEKPYRRDGAGLTLAALYLEEQHPLKDSLAALVQSSVFATDVFTADSTTKPLNTYHHLFLCNRLFLLNAAAIYTTGFECPDTASIVPELQSMLTAVGSTYKYFNESFPATPVTEEYLLLYQKAAAFVAAQPRAYSSFDHYHFLKDYINPLFALNQQMILNYDVHSRSMVDYSLNKNATSIFSKALYNGQNAKGIFIRVEDSASLAAIDRVGKLLFYDPLLSGNNQRSCASCHKSANYFTDNTTTTSLRYDHKTFLDRNTPSLINAGFNHLVMMDGKHYTLQNQTKAVITNPDEMGADSAEVVRKIMSCKVYNQAFKALLKLTPQEHEVTLDHITSAITYYYGKFSKGTATFDKAMNKATDLDASQQRGFNLFMSKAQCATCHFVPQFNGVKPPFVSSEFEVLGVPQDSFYKALSPDEGRYKVHAAAETRNAFRTGSLRNAAHTAPYMHNGVFATMNQVIDFYDAGGGTGHGLKLDNQTLAADSLHLTVVEKLDLLHFIETLNEEIPFEPLPKELPRAGNSALNNRKPGGDY